MKKIIRGRIRVVIVLLKNQIFILKLNVLKKRSEYSGTFLRACALAQNLRTNSKRKEKEVGIVYAAVSEMKSITDLDLFIQMAALSSTKNLAIEMYARLRWIINLKEFPRLAKKINTKKYGGKKAMKTLVNLVMPRFKNIEHATPFDISRMANVIHALPEKERNEVLERISSAMMKKVKNEKEFFCFLELINDVLAHNCMIAHFATSGKMKTLIIAEKVLTKIRFNHQSANGATETVIMESIQLFKISKIRELNHFLAFIEKLKITDKLQAAITKALKK